MPPDSYLPLPEHGRVFSAERQVRLGDSTPSGRLRFDAVARYLQDVAEDDATDAGWPSPIGWLLRRCAVTVHQFPVLGERLRLETFCSASASKWAERTTTMTGAGGGSLQATAVWIAIDVASGRPARLGDLFERVYVPSTEGRRASVRLSLQPPPSEAVARARGWPLRATDLDILGHVNNAISWAAVEDELARLDWLPQRAEVEHNGEITLGDPPMLATWESHAGLDLWLVVAGRVLTSARLQPVIAATAP
ncbi:MAG: acyl-[acyl-carrier-protein] thioesterase [Acidimicrobiales bacterium]